jgi:hypothetical protein
MVLTEGHVGLRALVLAMLNLLIVTASWVYFEHAHNILLALQMIGQHIRLSFRNHKGLLCR